MPTIQIIDLNAAKLELAQLTDFTTPLRFTGSSLGYADNFKLVSELLSAIPLACKSLDLSNQDLSELSLIDLYNLARAIR